MLCCELRPCADAGLNRVGVKDYISIFYTRLLVMPCSALLAQVEGLLGILVFKKRVMYAMGYNIGFVINRCSQVVLAYQ